LRDNSETGRTTVTRQSDSNGPANPPNRLVEVGKPISLKDRRFRFLITDAVEAAWNLTDCEKRLALRLVRLSARKGSCYAAQVSLARALGKSTRTIRRALRRLEELGYIRRVRKGYPGPRILFLWHASYDEWLGRAVREDGWTSADPASEVLLGDYLSGHLRPLERPSVTANQDTGDHIKRNTRKREIMASDRPLRGRAAASRQDLLRRRKVCPRCKNSGLIEGPNGPTWCECEVAARIRREKGENYPAEYWALKQELEQFIKQRVAGEGRAPDEPSSDSPSDGVINDALGG
jgi:predicted transcriptional regulator